MKLKDKIKIIKMKITQVYVAVKSKKTPFYAKAVGGLAIAYALSPIDLIPDFIPILGYLDDLIILPLLITITIKLIPKALWAEFEEDAKLIWKDGNPIKWYYGIPIVIIWIGIISWITYMIVK